MSDVDPNEFDLHVVRKAATLRTIVEDRMRSAIAFGRFKPGQRLVERELCELIGVGRTSIREALRQLEAEGLVTNVPHKGPSVSTIDYAEAEQLFAVRRLLEGYAGRGFAESRLPVHIVALTHALERFRTATEQDDSRELIRAKTAFYAALMDGCGNVFVRQMLTALHNRITLLRVTSMMQPGRRAQSMKEIEAIHDAIVAGKPDLAEALCHRHIELAAKVALAVLAKQKVEGEEGRLASVGQRPRAGGPAAVG